VFVSGLPGLVGSYQFIHGGHVLFSTPVLRSATLVPWVAASFYQIFFSAVSSPSFIQYSLSSKTVTILHEPYSLNWYNRRFTDTAFVVLLVKFVVYSAASGFK